jgi:hypothetical protein
LTGNPPNVASPHEYITVTHAENRNGNTCSTPDKKELVFEITTGGSTHKVTLQGEYNQKVSTSESLFDYRRLYIDNNLLVNYKSTSDTNIAEFPNEDWIIDSSYNLRRVTSED